MRVSSVFNFAPFILIQFDFTNAHGNNYNAIAEVFALEKGWEEFISFVIAH